MITPGIYRTRAGKPVQIMRVDDQFAHSNADFWHVADGKYVVSKAATVRNGQPIAGPHRFDLVERVSK